MMTRRLLQALAIASVVLASVAAPQAGRGSGPGECYAICVWQGYECEQGGGGWQIDCEDLDSYYDFEYDICDLDAGCLW